MKNYTQYIRYAFIALFTVIILFIALNLKPYINKQHIYTIKHTESVFKVAQNAHVKANDVQVIYQKNSRFLSKGDLIIFKKEFRPTLSQYKKFKTKLSKSRFVHVLSSSFESQESLAKHFKVNPENISFFYQKNPKVISKDDIIFIINVKSKHFIEFYPPKLYKTIHYTIKSNDTTQSIANKFNITKSDLIKWNMSLRFAKPRVGKKITIKNLYGLIYKVKTNDTLIKIANAYNVKPNDIVLLNVRKENFIEYNDTIFIFAQSFFYHPNMPSNYGKLPETVANKSIQKSVMKYAKMYNINPYIIYALINTESHFDPKAHSTKQCYGLMQVNINTAKIFDKFISKRRLFHSDTNIKIGAKYFGFLLLEFNGKVTYAIAAYNAGDATVLSWLKENPNLTKSQIPYKETRNYVSRVLSSYNTYYSDFLKKDPK